MPDFDDSLNVVQVKTSRPNVMHHQTVADTEHLVVYWYIRCRDILRFCICIRLTICMPVSAVDLVLHLQTAV